MTDPNLAELVGIVAAYCNRTAAMDLPRVTLFHGSHPTQRAPALFEPRFFLLLQGAKRLTFGDEVVDVEAGTAAVASVAVPFMSAVTSAHPPRPYIGLELRIDFGLLHDVLLAHPAINPAESERGVVLAPAPGFVLDPLCRLLRLLDTPQDVRVLAPLYEKEFWYRIVGSALGAPLRQLLGSGSRLHRIRRALDWINANPFAALKVAELAGSVDMSVTSFHRHFHAITASSPLAYQRHLRLLQARRMLAEGRQNVTQIAFATGYSSASQFSREYQALFGSAPRSDRRAGADEGERTVHRR